MSEGLESPHCGLFFLLFQTPCVRNMETEEQLLNIITPLLDGMGLSIVEMTTGRHRGDIKINLVLYKDGGISLEDLTSAQKILRPRLELDYERERLSIEISSPGLSRTIKSPREYGIFTGRRFRLLLEEQWIEGILKEAGEEKLLFDSDNQIMEIPIHGIRKAKLV